jgi:hypothetical protein
MSALVQNTYPTNPQQLFLEQKIRDDNNPGCIDERRFHANYRKNRPLFELQKKQQEEATKKWEVDQIAGYASRRVDFPEYHWRMYQDGKEYLRSSKNFNVYNYSQSSVIVGIWNEQTQRIEFVDELVRHNQELKNLLVKHKIRVE